MNYEFGILLSMSSNGNKPQTKKIKHLMVDLEITQGTLARKIGVSSRRVCHAINGTRVVWPLRKKIAAALGVAVEEIFPMGDQDAP